MRIFHIDLDVREQLALPNIGTLVAGDVETYGLSIRLFDGDSRVLLDDVEVTVVFRKANGAVVLQSTDDDDLTVVVEENTILCTMKLNAFSYYGQLVGEVLVRRDDSQLMTSQPFGFWVRIPLLNNEVIRNMDEYPLLLKIPAEERKRAVAETARETAEGRRVSAENIREENERAREELAGTLTNTFLAVTVEEGTDWEGGE